MVLVLNRRCLAKLLKREWTLTRARKRTLRSMTEQQGLEKMQATKQLAFWQHGNLPQRQYSER